MAETDLILCCYKGKAVYIRLAKDGGTKLSVAREAAIEAFEKIHPPLARHLRHHANLYKVIGNHKVYFVCLTGCNGKCVCGWTTVKPNDVVYLESKHRWYARLWFGIIDVFI